MSVIGDTSFNRKCATGKPMTIAEPGLAAIGYGKRRRGRQLQGACYMPVMMALKVGLGRITFAAIASSGQK